MNWVSEGDIVIVKMGKIINNDLELNVVNKFKDLSRTISRKYLDWVKKTLLLHRVFKYDEQMSGNMEIMVEPRAQSVGGIV